MKLIEFDDKALAGVNADDREFAEYVRTGAALVFYLQHRLTLGQAAEMAHMSQYEFMRFLGKCGLPCLDYPADELEQEAQA
jgi:predicted HTH domain antitoxin